MQSEAPCSCMDTREVLVVNPTGSNQVDPDYLESEKRLEKWFVQRLAETIGFITSTPENIPTTLKRYRSDFSAATTLKRYRSDFSAAIISKLVKAGKWRKLIRCEDLCKLESMVQKMKDAVANLRPTRTGIG
uniref:Uncharacterized protein n=1 Tax=Oryza rufipogon TaxID=4529 RepID=A0A0E0QQU2_ORYRU